MSDPNDFVHLHFHTEYSLLDGACRVKDAVKRAAELNMKALAITDHGNLHGAIHFYNACHAAGIKPIIGCEMYLTDVSMFERSRQSDGTQASHLLLLAKDEVGYLNLVKMVSRAYLEGFYYKPRIDWDLLSQHSEGLIATSTCIRGQVPAMILKGDEEGALKRMAEYAALFGKGNYYVELQDHGLENQRKVNRVLIEMARKLDLPLVATNDVHYIHQADSEAHEVLLCMQTQTTMDDPNRLKYGSDQFYMKSGSEMAKLFAEHPEALSNTAAIAEKCNLELKLGLDAPLHFPSFTIPEKFETHEDFFMDLCYQGLKRKYGVEDITQPKDEREEVLAARLDKEVGIIKKTGFVSYFLVVWDFIAYANTQNIPVGPGRGSGAGSIVAYLLDITGIDPIKYSLIFERFLNPERVSPPDFDIDFCQYRRGEVIEYVKDKYGQDACAQIVTFGTLGAKTVIRDLARVLRIELKIADRFAKMIPEDPGTNLTKALAANPEFKEATERDPDLKRIMKYAWTLEGLPRQQGTHAAGVVIGDYTLNEIIPLCKDKEGAPVTQYEMAPLEMTGLLKMDFLGLKTLTVVQEAVENVKGTCGKVIDMDVVPLDDEKTFDLLNIGDTTGVFQVESKGMRDLLRQFQLQRFEDLIAMIALYRPGPMDMIPDFIARRHKRVPITYDHPLLEPILIETYGVMIYQEQVQMASASLAGYSLGQGDMLRRAMGKKKVEVMQAERQKFIDGCKATNDIPATRSGQIFDNIEKFAGYGFNKSHSAAYGVISYWTAYLKAHHPVEFMAALMSCEMQHPDKLSFFIGEARESGIDVLPPSVNAGGARFKPDGPAIRFGMAGIKNVGAGAVEALVVEREANGLYKSMTDFCVRLGGVVNKKVMESLVQCGAFDFTGKPRSMLFAGIERVLQRASAESKDRAAGQGSLFDMIATPEEQMAEDELPEMEPWPEKEMLAHEKFLLGFYISGHPLHQHRWEIDSFATHDLDSLSEVVPGTTVRVAGLMTGLRKLFTKKKQEPMAAFALESEVTKVESVIFPSFYTSFGDRLADESAVMVVAEYTREEGSHKLMVQEVYPFEEVPRLFAKKMLIRVRKGTFESEKLEEVRTLMEDSPGSTPVVFAVEFDDKVSFIRPDDRLDVRVDTAFMKRLYEYFPPACVKVTTPSKVNLREKPERNFRKTG